MQVSRSRLEFDQKLFENNRKHTTVCERYQEEYEKMKEEMEGRINRLRAENSEKVEELETKISALLSGKMDMVFQMKEEVEGEYAERMEGLREIYRKEIAQQAEHQAKDSDKWRELESVLNQKIADKKAEVDDTISYYSQREAEYETKIDELMTRLQEQTAMYMKLQAEFDNYEWYEDGEVPDTTTGGEEGEEGLREGTMSRKSRESPMLRSRPPTRPPTREEGDIARHRAALLVEEDAPLEEAVFEPAPSPREREGAHKPDTTPDPDVPPRRGERGEAWPEDASNSLKRTSTSSSGKSARRSNCSQQ